MARQLSEEQKHVLHLIDALKITPEYFRDTGGVADVAATVDKIHTHVERPNRFSLPVAALYRINVDKLHDNLRQSLDKLNVGYCYMIHRRGKLAHFNASGWAQLQGDGDMLWGPQVPQNAGSVSKFITAIALVRLLKEKQIDVRSPIVGHLPEYWSKGLGVDSITFEHLLLHQSGLGGSQKGSGQGDFATAKAEIAKGPGKAVPAKYDYKNVNYTILRVLFATISDTVSPSFHFPSLDVPFLPPAQDEEQDDRFWNAVSAGVYVNYVCEKVFGPANVWARDLDRDPSASKAYGTPPLAPGDELFAGANNAGPSGWQLNVGELVRVLDAFRAGLIVESPENLLTKLYGIDRAIPTSAGPVYNKGGREMNGKLQGVDSAIYLMPGDINLAIFTNSLARPKALAAPPGNLPLPIPSNLDGVPKAIQDSVDFIF